MVYEVGQFDPKFVLFVGGEHLITEEVTRFIKRVEFESVDGMVDVVRLTINNPVPGDAKMARKTPFLWTDRKLFYSGNMLDLYMGYGHADTCMARVRLLDPEFNFPAEGTPTITISGYSPDHILVNNSPAPTRLFPGQEKPKEENKGRLLSEDIAEVVARKATKLGFIPDVDPVKMKLSKSSFQCVGMTDYDLLKGLSNMTGFIFWCDHFDGTRAIFSEKPVMHFKDPEKIGFKYDWPEIQDKIYTFKYGKGNDSTLLSFKPSFAITGVANKMLVAITLEGGKVIEAGVGFKEGTTQIQFLETEFKGDIVEDVIQKELKNAKQILFTINNFSVATIPTGQKFEKSGQLVDWLLNWFEALQREFIKGNGRTIGIESLLARQIHRIEGLGSTLDGAYYFSKVKHIMDDSVGYVCDISARKLIGIHPDVISGELEPTSVDDPAILAIEPISVEPV